MLTKLRLRQKGKSVSVLHGELKFLELLLALPNLKSVFKSARCAHGGGTTIFLLLGLPTGDASFVGSSDR